MRFFRAFRYSSVGVFAAGIIAVLQGCSDRESALFLSLICLLTFCTGPVENGDEKTTPTPFVIGNPVTDRSGMFSNKIVCVDLNNPATGSGTLTQWKAFVFFNTSGVNLTLIVYRDDGANYVNIGQTVVTPANSNTLQTFSANIPGVQTGDVFGLLMHNLAVASLHIETDDTGSVICNLSSDTSTQPKSNFGFNLSKTYSVRGTGM